MTTFFTSLGISIAVFLVGLYASGGPNGPRANAAALGSYLVALLVFLAAVGGWKALLSWSDGEEPDHHMKGWTRYFKFCVDHKVIGIQYTVLALIIFVVAGLMSILMRLELAKPGLQFLTNASYNSVMTMHGIGMIVVALISIVGGLGNFCVPLMIGAKDMAFPRLNALSFWILPPGVVILLASFLAGGMDMGWTAYPPLASQGALGKQFFMLAFVTVGFSSIFGAVNALTTTLTMRAKGMTMDRLPIFAWSMLAAGTIVVMATSVVAASLIMIISDRAFGTAFFDASRGGNALLYQHLFWYYSHPAVYVMILPAFGVALEILPVFARKPLFAYKLAAGSLFAIVILSFIVWAHHIFTSGMWDLLNIPFMVTTEMISVPTGVVFLAALGTLWEGKIRVKAPMLWALGFLFHFLIGGLTGIFLADVPTDLHLHDSLFVVAHFHFTIVGGVIFAFFAGLYYWFPKMTGRMMSETLAKVHFWLFSIGFNSVFITLFWVGVRGVPRRTADYSQMPQVADAQMFISVVMWVAVLGTLVFFYNLIASWIHGEKASANPWGGQTLEWTTSSPPPAENYASAPTVSAPPYEFGFEA